MYLIPTPKKIEIKEEKVTYNSVAPFESDIDSRVKKAIEKLPSNKNGAKLTVNISGEKGEEYTLDLLVDEIIISAKSAQGAFYAVQTLRQIFNNEDVFCMHIEDKPDFEHRGVYHDVTRGRIQTVDTLKAFIDNLAYYKINSLQLYVEHTFEFKEFKDSIEKTGYLSADEIRELDDYCYENFIEFIPSIATFGHVYELLERDEYKELCVLKDYVPKTHYWHQRMSHHTINPLHPKSFELVKSLIDQYMPLFRSNKFNICCDETFDLRFLDCGDVDRGKLYVDFVNKIIDYVKSKGKTPMMWADILLEHPEVIEQLPQDVILLNWDYGANPPEEKISKIANMGRTQIVCPGTTTWNRLCERVNTEEPNISLMAEYGHKHGAKGVLNTNWGDWGNICSLDLAMYGLTLGAGKSWNIETKTGDDFDKAVSHLLYENENGMKYLRELNRIHGWVSWIDFVKYYSNRLYPEQLNVNFGATPIEDIENIQKTCLDFTDRLSKEKWKNDEYRQEMLLAVEGTLVMAEFIAKVQNHPVKRRSNTEEWLKKYREKWVQKNKESELSEIEKVFRFYEGL